jgi:hypothetical protein
MKDREFELYNQVDRDKESDFVKDDLQRELIGVNQSRQKRSGVPQKLAMTDTEKKDSKERLTILTLADLMQDPEYAKLYTETNDLVHRLMRLTEEELDNANASVSKLSEERKELIDNANRLADGRVVFKDENGNVLTEDGDKITDPVLLEGIVFKDGATTYEEFMENKNAMDAALETSDELTRYQVEVLGDALFKLQDTDNPPSKKELEEIKKEIIDEAPPSIVEKISAPSDTPAHEVTQQPSSEIAILKF